MTLVDGAKTITKEKYPKAYSAQVFIWKIYDRRKLPRTQVGRGKDEASAWIDAATKIIRAKFKKQITPKKKSNQPREVKK